MVDEEFAATLQPGQVWVPGSKKRAVPRQIVSLEVHDGIRYVFWAIPGIDGLDVEAVSSIRVNGFRKWVLKHDASLRGAVRCRSRG